MTLAMISPSRRDVSPAEQLRQSPRLVLPRFRLVAAEFRPVSLLMIFLQGKRLHIEEDGHRRAARGPTRQAGAPSGLGLAPTLVARVWPPWPISFAQKFLLNPKTCFVEFQNFWSSAE